MKQITMRRTTRPLLAELGPRAVRCVERKCEHPECQWRPPKRSQKTWHKTTRPLLIELGHRAVACVERDCDHDACRYTALPLDGLANRTRAAVAAEIGDRAFECWFNRCDHEFCRSVPLLGGVHGKIAGYTVGGCRRECCAAGRREFAAEYAKRRKRNGGPLRVDAEPARRRMKWLAKQGLGYKTVAKLVGCTPASLQKLMGESSRIKAAGFQRGPTQRINGELSERIMALKPEDASGGQRIPAGPTLALIDELVDLGWPKVRLAERMVDRKAKCLQIGRGPGGRIFASTAARVRKVYAELIDAPVELRRNRYNKPKVIPRWAISTKRELCCAVCGTPTFEHSLTDNCAAA